VKVVNPFKVARTSLNEYIQRNRPEFTFSEVMQLKHHRIPPSRRKLFAFRHQDSITDWRIITDAMLGGGSTGTFHFNPSIPLKPTERDTKILRYEIEINDETRERSEIRKRAAPSQLATFMQSIEEKDAWALQLQKEAEEEEKRILAVINQEAGAAEFFGTLDLTLPTEKQNLVRSGFVCLKSPSFIKPLNLEAYDGLELRVRTDGRVYVFQIKTEGGNQDDLFQVILPAIEPGVWTRVYLAFEDFMLTWRGYSEDCPSALERSRIQSFGLLMAERQNGPFRIEIDWVHAVKSDSEDKPTRAKRTEQ